MRLVRFRFPIVIGLTAVTTGMWCALETGGVAAASSKSTIAASPASSPPACEVLAPPDDPSAPPPPLTPTTIDAIGQAYYCILDNYVRGPVLDDRSLLVPAFAALTQELQRRGLDQPRATLPALTGKNDQAHRDRNWTAFSQVYEQIIARLPQDPGVRQAVAEATMRGMVESLHDNHVHWQHGFNFVDFTGMRLSVYQGASLDPVATEPLFVTWVAPGGQADSAGIKPGDEIVAVNAIPPYINGVPSEGVLAWLDPAKARPGAPPVTITMHRPVTDATFTVTLTPPPPPPPGQDPPPPPPPPGELPPPPSKLVDGNIAYVMIPGFFPGVADQVLTAIAELGKNTQLRGVILDLRGNGGGAPGEVFRLLGAFVHDKVTSYFCDVKDHCTAQRPDDSVSLLNLPLVALTDRNCASACDSFASAVKDLHLGTLVGTRTAGVIAGPAEPYLLLDGSILLLPKYYDLAANGEFVNTIGVAPDHYAPLTAADLSAGRDSGLAKAVEVLR
jgi:carboxyl-terminal processing protease